MAKLIVLRALLRVGEYLIGFVDLLKPFLCFLVAGVDIGMVLLGERAIRLFIVASSAFLSTPRTS